MQPAHDVRRRDLPHRILLVLAVVVGALLVLALIGLRIAGGGSTFHATTYDPPEPATVFTLTDHTGQERSLADFAGAPVFLFFGFTHCPDICPLTLRALDAALADAGGAADDAQVLLVTVDPRRDSPEVLESYVRNFASDIVGLTGDEQRIHEILAAYGAYVEPGQHNPEVLAHTSIIFGIDSNGMIRTLLRGDAPRDEFHQDVRTLLRL